MEKVAKTEKTLAERFEDMVRRPVPDETLSPKGDVDGVPPSNVERAISESASSRC
jgi:hypothetical protein